MLETALRDCLTVTRLCTAKRSFSILQKTKTTLRSAVSDEHLFGLCMMSVHDEKISKEKQAFIERVANTVYLAITAKKRMFAIITVTWGHYLCGVERVKYFL